MIASSNCLGVPRPEGEIVLITDASDVGGGGTIYQWQELNPAKTNPQPLSYYWTEP